MLIVAHLLKKIPAFKELEYSLPVLIRTPQRVLMLKNYCVGYFMALPLARLFNVEW
jgi:hypothetical protein